MTSAIENHGNDEFFSIISVIIFSISYLINLLCILFFNEVLILNILKLDYNTKKRIIERMHFETYKAIRDNKLFENEDEENEDEDNECEENKENGEKPSNN